MDFQRKVEIDDLQELENTQKSDLETVLEAEEAPVTPMLWTLEEVAGDPEEIAREELVKAVHDRMADDLAALVHEHVINESEDDAFEFDQMDKIIPNFFADTAIAAEDEHPAIDDGADFVISSANRTFFDEADLWNGGGGGGGGGAGGGGGGPPADGSGSGDDGTVDEGKPPKKPKKQPDDPAPPAKPVSKKPAPGGEKGK